MVAGGPREKELHRAQSLDVYSLGALIGEIFLGVPPYSDCMTDPQIVRAMETASHSMFPAGALEAVSKPLAQLVLGCTLPDIGSRHSMPSLVYQEWDRVERDILGQPEFERERIAGEGAATAQVHMPVPHLDTAARSKDELHLDTVTGRLSVIPARSSGRDSLQMDRVTGRLVPASVPVPAAPSAAPPASPVHSAPRPVPSVATHSGREVLVYNPATGQLLVRPPQESLEMDPVTGRLFVRRLSVADPEGSMSPTSAAAAPLHPSLHTPSESPVASRQWEMQQMKAEMERIRQELENARTAANIALAPSPTPSAPATPASAAAASAVGMSPAQRRRIEFEMRLLKQHLPNFKWIEEERLVTLDIRSHQGNLYQVGVVLGVDYPSSMPELVLLQPNPFPTREGIMLPSARKSHEFALLGTGYKGFPRISHSKPQLWSEQDTIFKVLLQAHLWLAAYDFHLQSGSVPRIWLKAS
jgi:hypothetical protein